MQSKEQKEYARDLINTVEFTHHALDRMAERNIPISAVLGAIDQGRYLPGYEERDCILLNGLHVVMDSNVVITTFYRED